MAQNAHNGASIPFSQNAPHYTIERAGQAWSVKLWRKGVVAEVMPATSFAEAFRLSRTFADARLVGYVIR